MSVNQNQIGNEHPADRALNAEHGTKFDTRGMSADERALWQTPTSELKNRVLAEAQARDDFRSMQQSMNYMEATAASAAANPNNNEIVGNAISAGLRAEAADRKARASAHWMGGTDTEYDDAVNQLAALSPHAPGPDPNAFQPSADAPPYTISQGPDGYTIRLDTGETFKGDADKVIRDLAHSKQKTSVWGRQLNAELKQYRNAQAAPQNGQPQQFQQPDLNQQPQPGWDSIGQLPDEGSRFLVENAAKVLGYNSADELINHQLERDRKLAAMEQKMETFETERLAQDFQVLCPDFPGTEAAADTVVKIIEASGLDYTADNCALAHQHAIRKGLYQPLRREEYESSYQPQQNSGRTPPPQPPGGNNPDGSQWNVNPWQQSTDELKRRVLEGGGLGKALLEMKPGETFGV